MNENDQHQNRIEIFAKNLLDLARDTIIVNMRFMDVAACRLPAVSKRGLNGVAGNERSFFYDPGYVLRKYTEDPCFVARMYLHTILHYVFNHAFGYAKLDEELWDLSCDIAVENMIMELELSDFRLSDDDRREIKLKGLKKGVDRMTSEKIYKYFLVNPLAASDKKEFSELFFKDRHIYWKEPDNLELSRDEWQKISERIKADIRTFSKNSKHSESLFKNLDEATRERYDFKRMLERFTVTGEELSVSEDEFDYIYYTYGFMKYGNMPLIEPLEFRDVKKIRDFAIVLDTSASCRGDIIRSFLKKTYNILKGSENFFKKINVHIIQSDNEVHEDTKIENEAQFDAFLKRGKLVGFGGTDFRPAIEYVNKLVEDGEFVNFKGLIYFTDGYGIYPVKAPGYDCMFVFLSDDDRRPEVPWWAIPAVLSEEEISKEKLINSVFP
ncbi:MAG: VWA-like domain-containing protein [Lachnospiraceae bacterium]|nr:VWA-like domain-containing protein [Lachnospiraceae bacterium]